MSCYHPLRGIVLGVKENGKKNIKIIKDSDFSFYSDDVEYIEIPCGHCIGCRLKYSRIWADRCLAESQYHENNIFLTLTYDDEHLPEQRKFSDGSLSPIHSLVKRDLQLFIKRLRSLFPEQKIRYFACGEYGSKNMRPHYHLIIFGLKLADISLLYKNSDNYKYYTSDSISKIWKYGFHIITDVNWSTCAYVARYITKKQYGAGSMLYEQYNYQPEFTLMSRRPGIGRQFYDDYKFNLYYDDVFISTDDGKHQIKPNVYYDKLFDLEYPECMEPIREDRQRIAIQNNLLKSNLTTLKYLDILKAEETTLSHLTKILGRKEL